MEATFESVVHDLMYDDDIDPGTGETLSRTNLMTRKEAEELVAKHRDILDQGMRLGSYTYYVVNQILNAEAALNNDPEPPIPEL